MAAINRVTISGNLTRDPELKATMGGTNVLTFGVAVNEKRKAQSGEWEDYANFLDVVVFGNYAVTLADLLHKGDKVAIDGKLSYRAWEGSDGSKRSKVEVVGQHLDILARRPQKAPELATDDIPF